MDLSFPFSKSFGLADTRQSCVQSAEEIYKCLARATPDGPGVFQFATLSVLAKDPDTGELDEAKLKDLVKVFRPERDGTLSLIEFVRSVDRVYKDLRLLRASIRNSSCLDQAFEAYVSKPHSVFVLSHLMRICSNLFEPITDSLMLVSISLSSASCWFPGESTL